MYLNYKLGCYINAGLIVFFFCVCVSFKCFDSKRMKMKCLKFHKLSGLHLLPVATCTRHATVCTVNSLLTNTGLCKTEKTDL